MQLLKRGKQALKEGHGPAAKQAFSSALLNLDDVELELESPWRARRKALRGMGAACGCLGEHSEALGYMEQVVSISEANEDMNGLADAYGVTADLYTELGDYEHAALWYDKYIETMNKTL